MGWLPYAPHRVSERESRNVSRSVRLRPTVTIGQPSPQWILMSVNVLAELFSADSIASNFSVIVFCCGVRIQLIKVACQLPRCFMCLDLVGCFYFSGW